MKSGSSLVIQNKALPPSLIIIITAMTLVLLLSLLTPTSAAQSTVIAVLHCDPKEVQSEAIVLVITVSIEDHKDNNGRNLMSGKVRRLDSVFKIYPEKKIEQPKKTPLNKARWFFFTFLWR